MDRPSAYSYWKLFGHFWNLIFTTGTRPLRLITLMGFLSVLMAFGIAAYALYGKLYGDLPVQGWASLLIVGSAACYAVYQVLTRRVAGFDAPETSVVYSALLGSVLYLLGVVLLYGAYGTLDIALLAERVRPEPAAWVAAALMTAGLLAKTALFPLHLWLPPAHAGAPPAASAILSSLVVKGSFILLVRLWFEVMPALWSVAATQLIAALGAAAILYGSVLALRQERLKLLIAYSTVAQIGYLFLMFPLAYDPATAQLQGGVALTGGVLQTVSHAFAKAGMYMAAGLIDSSLGHDRVADLAGVGRALPMSLIAFGLAGVSLVGLPPSGGFVAKWLLLSAAVSTGQWWWATVLVVGGLLTGGYVMLVLIRAMGSTAEPVVPLKPVARSREAVALAMSLCAVLLGLLALGPVELPAFGTSGVVGAVAEVGP
jgi:formate hydrogenlyase subunit 3/multisubunit Na+/H+ antiporter MnhD subunit